MEMQSTFFAALRSVGTASTMAAAGFYFHRRKLVTAAETKVFARLSQQVTIPCLFFTRIIYCPQNNSAEQCPNITDSLRDIWVLLLWPLYVVGCGLIVGEVVYRLSSTPKWQRTSVLAACAFANWTGLPITLLTVIHSNFPASSEIGSMDPNLFLSVYMILYPVMLWGVGGWLLAPGESSKSNTEDSNHERAALKAHDSSEELSRGASASQLISELARVVDQPAAHRQKQDEAHILPLESNALTLSNPTNDIPPLTETIFKALPKAFQPPVIGAILGLFIAAFEPLRGLLVDLKDRDGTAPLEWLFDGLYAVR